jgi:hypothetical protein
VPVTNEYVVLLMDTVTPAAGFVAIVNEPVAVELPNEAVQDAGLTAPL